MAFDIFEDLVGLSEDLGEAKMIFFDDWPMVMEESEAVELRGKQIEEIYYQPRQLACGPLRANSMMQEG